MTDSRVPEPDRQRYIRQVLMNALEEAAQGGLLSVVVLGETTDGDYLTIGTAVDSMMGMSGYLHHVAHLMAAGHLDPESEDEDNETEKD